MPLGIGQLSRLQKLGLFVVGKGEKVAGISELANISRIGDERLTIKGIAHVIEPNDAHMASLKQKTNIQRLHLHWRTKYDGSEAHTDLEQAVLDVLEPPPGIKELEIHRYSGRQYARWIQSQVSGGVQAPVPYSFLRVMRLYDFPNLKNLHGLVELPCLEELKLQQMPSLESISGGPFPRLVNLQMRGLPCLGEVWMVAERTLPDGQLGGGCCNFTPQLGQFRVGNCLTELEIRDCRKLEVKLHLPPSLQRLILWCNKLPLKSPGQCHGSSLFPCFSHLKKLELWGLESGNWKLLQYMTALETLDIKYCYRLTKLPKSVGSLTSLQELRMSSCHALEQFPECLGELHSLRLLDIADLPGVTCLPQSVSGLTSLQVLQIKNCPGLTSLLEGMKGLSSLQDLSIEDCDEIKSLPDGIKDLTALKTLTIGYCPSLARRCKRGKGDDWHLVSHIPDLWISYASPC